MRPYEHIADILPKYAFYLHHEHAKDILKELIKEKKGGKVFVKFFKAAVACDEWKTDDQFRKLLDKAVNKASKLDKKQQKKFTEIHTVFTAKVDAVNKAKAADAAANAAEKAVEHGNLNAIQGRAKESVKALCARVIANYKAAGHDSGRYDSARITTQQALQFFGVETKAEEGRIYKQLLLVIHPDRWTEAGQESIRTTADKLTKFVTLYHAVAQA